MICFKCDSEKFVLKDDATVEQEFRGETLNVKTPVMACEKCGWQTLASGQLDELRKRTADAYRVKHGLLTSTEIKAMRTSLKMNQPEFAKFIGVGEASVKRWETWQVQDVSSDRLIRLTFENESLRRELAAQAAKSEKSDHLEMIAESFLASHFSFPTKAVAGVFWDELMQLVPSISKKEVPALSNTGKSPYLGPYADRKTIAVKPTLASQSPIELTSAVLACAPVHLDTCGLSPPQPGAQVCFFFSNAFSQPKEGVENEMLVKNK